MTLEENNLNELFQNYQWSQIQNTPTHTTFQRDYDETASFELETFPNYISVTIPIKLGNIRYTTKFTNYSDAVKYLTMHLNYYEDL